MSAYVGIESEICEQESIVKALIDMGFTREEIEVHQTAINLYGYHGDKRMDTANIIVRQKYVNTKMSSGSSNDLGFKLVNGRYTAIVSEYDNNWWSKKKDRFMQVAATNDVVTALRRKGNYTITQKEVNGVIKIYAKG